MGEIDRLAPLRAVIEQATYTMEATAKEIQDPDETILRGFGKQLGNSKKEIMATGKDLVINQPTGVAMEASRLAGEACDAIKASQEAIRAALRELGAASDISEASGPTRAQWPPSARPVVGQHRPGLGDGRVPGGLGMGPAATPNEGSGGRCRPGVAGRGPASNLRMATSAYAGHHSLATRGTSAEAQDQGSGRGTVGSHAGHDERPGER